MADYVPFEIQKDIMKSLPTKSLIRFRSVSKAWKSLIESSKFIATNQVSNTQVQQYRLLVSYFDLEDFDYKYVSIVDDDTFPKHKLSLHAPMNVELFKYLNRIGGSSQGLFCFGNFCNFRERDEKRDEKSVVLWNPSIRKSVSIVVPHLFIPYDWYDSVIGFGVCPNTNDPKLVKINFITHHSYINFLSFIPQVEVFTLSSRVWRSPLCSILPRTSIELEWNQVVIDRFIYWRAYDNVTADDVMERFNMILSFDMITEEFTEIFLPNSLATYEHSISITELRESLVVLQYKYEDEKQVCGVWMMEHGVPNSFTKLFTINTPDAIIENVSGFRKSGEPVIAMRNDPKRRDVELFVYEPCSQHINHIGISGKSQGGYSFIASSYKETLLLLDY